MIVKRLRLRGSYRQTSDGNRNEQRNRSTIDDPFHMERDLPPFPDSVIAERWAGGRHRPSERYAGIVQKEKRYE